MHSNSATLIDYTSKDPARPVPRRLDDIAGRARGGPARRAPTVVDHARIAADLAARRGEWHGCERISNAATHKCHTPGAPCSLTTTDHPAHKLNAINRPDQLGCGLDLPNYQRQCVDKLQTRESTIINPVS